MKTATKWLRISYWIGAIVDAKAALIFLFPSVVPQLYLAITGHLPSETASVDITFRILSTNMVFAWTCLLLWADQKPLERKGVLLLTIFPVTSGIIALRIYTGLYSADISGIFTLFMIALALLFIFSYIINFLNKSSHKDCKTQKEF